MHLERFIQNEEVKRVFLHRMPITAFEASEIMTEEETLGLSQRKN